MSNYESMPQFNKVSRMKKSVFDIFREDLAAARRDFNDPKGHQGRGSDGLLGIQQIERTMHDTCYNVVWR